MDRELLQFLIDREYAIVVGDKAVLTKKFKDLFPEPVVSTLQLVATVDKEAGKKELWNKFIADAEIPHRVKSNRGESYTVRQYSLPAINKLVKVINTPGIEYDMLVKSTKQYYKTVTFKQLLSNYLIDDTWLHEYEEFKKGNVEQNTGSGGNRFED